MSAGWSIEETRELFNKAEQCQDEGSLNKAFREIAGKFGRKPNSVRNYYYSQLKAFSLVPDLAEKIGIKTRAGKKQFQTFEEHEIDSLIKTILVEQGKGNSVRAIVTNLASGDKTLALRYQNKYRSVVAGKRSRLNRIIEELNGEYATYRHPITNLIVRDGKTEKEETVDSLLNNLSDIFNIESFKNLLSLAEKGRRRYNDNYLAEIERKTEQIERLENANKKLAEKLLELKNQNK